jgi:hypothetical protein
MNVTGDPRSNDKYYSDYIKLIKEAKDAYDYITVTNSRWSKDLKVMAIQTINFHVEISSMWTELSDVRFWNRLGQYEIVRAPVDQLGNSTNEPMLRTTLNQMLQLLCAVLVTAEWLKRSYELINQKETPVVEKTQTFSPRVGSDVNDGHGRDDDVDSIGGDQDDSATDNDERQCRAENVAAAFFERCDIGDHLVRDLVFSSFRSHQSPFVESAIRRIDQLPVAVKYFPRQRLDGVFRRWQP